MNKVILIGRLTKDPDVQEKFAKYTLAVDRAYKAEGQADADFINCKVFGKSIDFVEKYLNKGMKILVEGRIQTGSYEKEDGTKVYTTDVVVDRHEFVESRRSASEESEAPAPAVKPEPGNLNSLADAYPAMVKFVQEDEQDALPF